MSVLSINTRELGHRLRAERQARGRTQAWLAERVRCQRQTIAELEAGRNVSTHILMAALAALGKGLIIADARIDLERIGETFGEDTQP
jgi:HTH-type transcriptional regulator/antitoxin HipB